MEDRKLPAVHGLAAFTTEKKLADTYYYRG